MRKLKVSKKIFDFDAQLAEGAKGEADFSAKYPALKLLDGKQGDFLLPDGRKLELKTDAHPRSEYFFMERWSNIRYKKPGGPWQSAQHGCDLFVYRFSDGREYWFNTISLVSYLTGHLRSYELKEITNRFFTAYGLLVPITELEPLRIEVPECCLKSSEK